MVLYHHFPSFSSSVLCCCSCCCCCCCCCFLSFFFDNDSPSHLASLYTLINCDKCFPRTIYGGSVRKVEPVDTCPLPPPLPPTRGTHVLFLLFSRILKQQKLLRFSTKAHAPFCIVGYGRKCHGRSQTERKGKLLHHCRRGCGWVFAPLNYDLPKDLANRKEKNRFLSRESRKRWEGLLIF